ncbi:MAG: FIST C-terminal domain-containing protein [Burkholderiales bacterium]|nr:FIST C-terminal domain-containing protein [Burkholderiales bacterium]
MQTRQCVVNSQALTPADLSPLQGFDAHLVLVFASLEAMQGLNLTVLQQALPSAQWVGCSTAGEISGEGVSDGTIVLTALHFDQPAFRVASEQIHGMADSLGVGERLGHKLASPALRHVLVLGQGADINGSGLVEGLKRTLGADVVITGGLAGDGGRFTGAQVLGPDGVSGKDIVAIGFDGPGWHITHGSFGGWQRFGPIRTVTRCDGNVLYELDGERALDIYKRYLGDYAAQLPASGLLFPWSVLGDDRDAIGVTRTILGVNEADGSLVLAGDVPQGGHMQLMHASVDALVDAAESAATAAKASAATKGDTLALLVSCIGRKLVMGARVDEEVEAVGQVMGRGTTVTGFYSNGEISPHHGSFDCKLHNQTMTITLVSEVAA